MPNTKWALLVFYTAVVLSGCSWMGSSDDDPIEPENQVTEQINSQVVLPKPANEVSPEVKRVQGLTNATDDANEMTEEQKGEIRRKAIGESGYVWGLQRGLYERTAEIQKVLDKNATNLDLIFDARKFIVDGKVLLPIISESSQMYDQTGEKEARMVATSYTFSKQATIVPFAPTWRDYLIRSVDQPAEADPVMLPRTSKEREVWKESTERGWKAGRLQADEIFEIDLRTLQFETEGRYRFKKLAAMGVLSMPRLSSSDVSVMKLDDGKTLNINDVVYKIVTDSSFQTDSSKWRPYFNGRK